jgi:hypothetical protein
VRIPIVHKSVVALLALSMLPACPLVEVEVEVPEVCITYDDIEVTGATPEIHESFVVDDLGELPALTEHAEGLAFRRAEAIAVSGIDNFDFVESARIRIAPGREPTVPSLTLYACDGDCVTRADALALGDDEQADVLDYLRGDAITLELELAGEPPPVAWTMSVVVCFEGRVRYAVGE